ncbi:MAG: PAS domain S-box protein [Spirochaetes bacterium]|nr:PAS domain S-box protein [Spirochaetota bacterium]
MKRMKKDSSAVQKKHTASKRKPPATTKQQSLTNDDTYRNLFLNAALGIFHSTFDGRFIDVNPALAKMMGYSSPEEVVRSITNISEQVYAEPPKWRETAKAAMEAGGVFSAENRYRRKNGEVWFGKLHLRIVSDAQGKPGYYEGFIEDITERTRAENELRDSERRHKVFLDLAVDAILIGNPAGIIIEANESAVVLTGYQQSELIGASINLLFTEEERRRVPLMYEELKQGKTVRNERMLRRKDGSSVAIEMRTKMMPDRTYQTFIRDVSERKRAEYQLRIKDWAVESTLDAIALSDLDGMVSYVNPAFLRMWGYDSPAEVLGRPVSEFWQTGKQAADVIEALRVHGGWLGEMMGKSKSGSKFFVQTSASMIKDADGRPIQMMASFMDITERKIAETALRDSEEKFKTAFQTSPDSININRLDDGRYISINSGFTRIMGYTESDIIGKTSLEMNIWADPNDRAKLVAGLRQHGKVENLEATFIAKNGEPRLGLMSATVMSINGIPHILNVTRDMTERQKLVESLKRAEKLESLGVLAGGIAHDFNNLLAGMFGFIEAAKRNLPQGISSEHLDRVLELYGRAKGLSQQLLTFSKGGAPLKKTGALEPLIRKSVLFALSGSVVQADFTIAGDLAPAEFDESQIAQVIGNIVINAVQAMPTGGKLYVSAGNATVRENEHPPLPAGSFVHIAIRDTGIGMPHDILQRIFDPFFTTKQTGSGLGLAICFSIIQKHGGVIEAESSPGNGSTFHLYLPASSTARSGASLSSAEPVLSGSERILVMDDEDYLRECLNDGLAAFGYDVHTARDGAEAVVKIAAAHDEGKPFRAVFLDLTVRGGMGGREALRKIRERFEKLPVFLMSGYSDDQSTVDSDPGFNGSLQKPFSINDLIILMRKYVPRSSL